MPGRPPPVLEVEPPGDREEICFDREITDRLLRRPHPDERLRRDVPGVIRIAAQPEGEPEDVLRVALVQLCE